MTPRPTLYDPRVLRPAATDLVEDFKRATGEKVDEEDAIHSVSEAIRYDDDGYDVCRNLDNDGWDCDAQMVEIMDNAGFYKSRYHDGLVAEWVKDNNIAPPFPLGTKVRFTRGMKGPLVGEIIRIDSEKAQYLVFCADQGHVREGIGTHGCMVEYEKCEAVP